MINWIKRLITGTSVTGIITSLLWETLKSLFLRITWKVVIERFITRAIINGLLKLQAMSTNDLTRETVDDILKMLHSKRLKMAKLE